MTSRLSFIFRYSIHQVNRHYKDKLPQEIKNQNIIFVPIAYINTNHMLHMFYIHMYIELYEKWSPLRHEARF